MADGILRCMTRILLRSPKSPFESVSPEVMLRDDLISSNSGNLIFLESAWKILDTTGTEIVPDRVGAARDGRGPDQ